MQDVQDALDQAGQLVAELRALTDTIGGEGMSSTLALRQLDSIACAADGAPLRELIHTKQKELSVCLDRARELIHGSGGRSGSLPAFARHKLARDIERLAGDAQRTLAALAKREQMYTPAALSRVGADDADDWATVDGPASHLAFDGAAETSLGTRQRIVSDESEIDSVFTAQAMLRERENGVREISTALQELADLGRDLNEEILRQGAGLTEAESATDSARSSTTKGRWQLLQAYKLGGGGKAGVVGALMGGLIGGPMGAVAGAKGGLLALVSAGSIGVGYVTGRAWRTRVVKTEINRQEKDGHLDAVERVSLLHDKSL